MSLCTLCTSINLLSIPRLPTVWDGYTLPGADSVLICIMKSPQARAAERSSTKTPGSEGDDGNAGAEPSPLGTPYHPSLSALTSAAETCPLCALILRDIQRFQADYDAQDESRKARRGGPDFEMYLARGSRVGTDMSGFMVLCRDSKSGNMLWVLGGIGIAVEEGDGLASYVGGRVIDGTVTGDGTFGRVRGWLGECLKGHGELRCCGHKGDSGDGESEGEGEEEGPKRLIWVNGPGNSTNSTIRIRDGKRARGQYVALSYVASETDIKSIRASISEDLSPSVDGELGWDLDFTEWPAVYRDAILMTRKLRFGYLWIDAICLTDEDMSSPYLTRDTPTYINTFKNASIVLAASRSPNPQTSFLTERIPPTYTELPYTQANATGTLHLSSAPLANTIFPLKTEALRNEPLTHSAWHMQERYFSPRILHFGTEQLYFECYGGFWSEDGLKMTGRIDGMWPTRQPQVEGTEELKDVSDKRVIWRNVVSGFCRKKLDEGRDKDKLPALGNMARVVNSLSSSNPSPSNDDDDDNAEANVGDIYLAGLWRNTLIEGLIWQSVGFTSNKTSSPPYYRAPSWSWASIDGPFGQFVKYSGFDEGEWVDLAHVTDVSVTLKDESKPYGEVVDGWIDMRVPMVGLVNSVEGVMHGLNTRQGWKMRSVGRGGDGNGEEGEKKTNGTFVIFDTPERADEARAIAGAVDEHGDGGEDVKDVKGEKKKLCAIVLSKHKSKFGCGGGECGWGYHAVVVVEVEGREGVWKRLGKVVLDDERLGEGWEEGMVEIKLV